MTEQEQLVLDHLSQFVSDHKKEFTEKVLSLRTRYITVVLEDIFQSQNASAVVRSTECMGIQDIHIVETISKYQTNIQVLKGSNKWIDIHRYNTKGGQNIEACLDGLRQQNYRILVADPADDGVDIHNVDITQGKIALLFGNELRGVSEYVLRQADQKVRIPMFGFTESLNLSVSVAICLNILITKLHASDVAFGLSEEEKKDLTLAWYRKMVKRSDLIEREFLRTID